ncbi:unnamed protein product [Schistosoma mattheei]|uniref:Uncharacterized protein n=1 Tax=Schistosoma mattheei TaxID=31246 RepID=A0A183PB81_9TREM|nr:unnamed protein product [Schistosoma mattheei]
MTRTDSPDTQAIHNVFVEIHWNFYQSVKRDDCWDILRRDGRLVGSHNSQKCIAYQNGLYRDTDFGNNNKLFIIPSFSEESDEQICLEENLSESPTCKRQAVE